MKIGRIAGSRSSTEAVVRYCICGFLAGIVLVAACGTTPTSPPSSSNLSLFKLADNQVAGWIQDTSTTDAYTQWQDTSLYHPIDGGARLYVAHHVVQTSIQKMIGPNGASMEVWAMDFGAAACAATMFTDRKAAYTAGTYVADGAYPLETAFVLPTIMSVLAVAHFDRYYFEISVKGADSTSEGIAVADTVLHAFDSNMR